MEKLTLEQLSPYLPYGLKFGKLTNSNKWLIYELELLHFERGAYLHLIEEYTDLSGWNNFNDIGINAKPILRPLEDFIGSEADKEIFGKGTYNMDSKINYNDCLYYWEVQILLKHHFDVFQLIPRGLALSIHDIK